MKENDHVNLNQEQLNCIRSSTTNKLTVIWGPPGTGKTKTLQAIIAEFLTNHKKILFASNTNNAIDGLIEDFIDDKNSPYEIFNSKKKEGKIVRLGSQCNEEVETEFSLRAIAEKKKY